MSERFVHGGNIYRDASVTGRWLDFSANINPLGMAEGVRQAITENIEGLVHYPDPEAKELKAALASYYRVAENSLVLGNGAAELFYLFMNAVRPKRVMIPVPSFSEYERSALAAQAEVIYFYLEEAAGFQIDIQKLAQAARREHCDAIVLGNPNNPTGCLLRQREIQNLLALLPDNTWLLVDESFLDFLEETEPYTVRKLAETHAHVVVVQSLTKFYALPGLRLGFGIAHSKLARRLEMGKDVWNVNLLAQKAGVAALAQTAYAQKTRQWLQTEKGYLAEQLAKCTNWKIYAPTVNFLLVRLPEADGPAVVSGLRSLGVLVRDCSNYPGLDEHYLRIAVRSHQENMQFLQALKESGAGEW